MSSIPFRSQWTRFLLNSPSRGSRIRPRRSLSSSTAKVPSIYVAATRQHVGKTSVSLALMSGLKKRFDRVGFLKPVGQKSVTAADPSDPTKTIVVDKDAALIHQHFGLDPNLLDCISPVLIPAGYTKDYLDGKIPRDTQQVQIQQAFQRIQAVSDVVLCEGTGHCAVGSIVQASNAQVASWTDSQMVLVVNGGLGSSFDELVLNQTLCDAHNVSILGVVMNQINHDKYDQTVQYMTKALEQLNVPLLGCIPERPFLGSPTLSDLERLLDGQIVTGRQHLLRHYQVSQELHLVACSLEVFLQRLRSQRDGSTHTDDDDDKNMKKHNHHRTLYVCHASRHDILLGFLMEAVQHNLSGSTADWLESSLVVTGCGTHPLSAQVLEIMTALPCAPPVLMTPHGTDEVLKRIYQYTPKLNMDDPNRVVTAIQHYEPYIDFDLLLKRIGVVGSKSTTSSSTLPQDDESRTSV